MGKRKTKIISVDFQRLERRGYKSSGGLGKEIIDAMVKLGQKHENKPTPRDEARKDIVHAALDDLSKRQREVIELSLGFNGQNPIPTKQIAAKLQISPQAASEVKRRAFKKLKKIITLNQDALKNIKNN